MLEIRKANIIAGASGGTSSENSRTYKISLPTKWIREMNISKENREVLLTFDGETISIAKKTQYSDFVKNKKDKKHSLKIFKLFEKDFLYSEICADYTDKTVCVKNFTDNPLKTPFGVNDVPLWEDFLEFLESRCLPQSRAGLREYLEALGLSAFEPVEIIKKTGGKMKEDNLRVEIEEP